jgi:hypothetical protein
MKVRTFLFFTGLLSITLAAYFKNLPIPNEAIGTALSVYAAVSFVSVVLIYAVDLMNQINDGN